MKLIKITKQGTTRTNTIGLFQCEYCPNTVEKTIKNGERTQSCGCLVHHRKQGAGRVSVKTKPITKATKAEAREKAILHCPKYRECNEAASKALYGGCEMKCHKCPDMEKLKKTNCWYNEVNIGGCRSGYNELTEHRIIW